MSLAQCSICSRYDNNIAVICERRCLICGRCQSNQVIRLMMIESAAAAECPLCEKPMSRTMTQWCDREEEALPPGKQIDTSKFVNDLDVHSNPFPRFLRKFKAAYGNLGGVYDVEGGKDGDSSSNKLDVDPMYMPPKYNVDNVLDFASECFCQQWNIVLRNGNESMTSVFLRMCNRKKLSQRTNDFKAKAILDFMGTQDQHIRSSPMVTMFGRIVGLIPRSKTQGYVSKWIRKAWGSIAVSVIALIYCDRCGKTNQLKDDDDNPKVGEFRAKVNKLSNNKTVGIKRCLRTLHILQSSSQPHWIMSPFLSSCKEYNCIMPWSAESVAKLLNFMVYVCRDVDNVIKPAHIHATSTKGNETISKLGPDWLLEMKVMAKRIWSAEIKHTDDYNKFLPGLVSNGCLPFLTPETILGHVDSSLNTTAAHLVLLVVEAWELECERVKEALQRAVISATRRMGVRGIFDPEVSTLSITEKRCLTRLLKYYAAKNIYEVDWQEVRDINSRNEFPFFIADGLIEKSSAELNHHARQIAAEWDVRKTQELMEDLSTTMRERGMHSAINLMNTNLPNRDVFDQAMVEDFRDDLSSLSGHKKKVVARTGKQQVPPKLLAVEQQQEQQAQQSTLTAKMQRHSDLLDKNPHMKEVFHKLDIAPLIDPKFTKEVNMVEVLDNNPSMLQRLKLFTRMSIGPQVDPKLIRGIADDLSEMFQTTVASEEYNDDDTLASSSVADESVQSMSIAGSLLPGDEQEDLDQDNEDNDRSSKEQLCEERSWVQGLDSAAGEKKEQGIQRQRGVALGPTISGPDGKGHRYIAKRRAVDMLKLRRQKEEQKAMQPRLERIKKYELKKREEEAANKKKETFASTLDLRGVHGEAADGDEVDEARRTQALLAAEKAVKQLVLRDEDVSLDTMLHVMRCYCSPWQLKELEYLDLSYCNLGHEATVVLADHFRPMCKLSHLHYPGNFAGESALHLLLSGMVEGGAGESLQTLDLRQNKMTMVGDSLRLLSSFHMLKNLNLAHNFLSIENERHKDIFVGAMKNLRKLEKLSLSGNRIQDLGFGAMQEVLIADMKSLVELDMSKTFLTTKSFANVHGYLKHFAPVHGSQGVLGEKHLFPLRFLDLRGNIFTLDDQSELKYVAHHLLEIDLAL